MIQYHKRGLFDIIKDTVWFYRNDANCRGCELTYSLVNGYVKDGKLYSTKMLRNPYTVTLPLRFEEEFSNFTKDDYDKLGVDYIAVYDCPHLDYNDNCSIVSYRRYDGVYNPTAQKYISLFVKI